MKETPPAITPQNQSSSFGHDTFYSGAQKELDPLSSSQSLRSNSSNSLKSSGAKSYPSSPPNRHQQTIATLSAPTGTLPPQLSSLLSSIHSTLKTSFATGPPHTIQRLAELALHPSIHYRTLPSYLRAIDRVISVSSTADIFPLPSVETAFLNGDGSGNNYLSTNARQDDFNGAALTRIPWLREAPAMAVAGSAPDLRTESTAVIDGPNGAGSLETVTVAINDMGNLRRENNGSKTDTKPITAAKQLRLNFEEDADEKTPHARGPEEIGVEDMGPQGSSERFDIEAALGRKGEGASGLGAGMGMSTLTSEFSTEEMIKQRESMEQAVAERKGLEKVPVEPDEHILNDPDTEGDVDASKSEH